MQSSLDAFRAALTVPVAMVVLGALITAFGLRAAKGPSESGRADAAADAAGEAFASTASR